MDVLDAIEQMLAKAGKSKSALAESLGRSRQSIYNMFRDKADVRVDTLANMADFLGYELVLRSKDDEIIITPRQEDKEQ